MSQVVSHLNDLGLESLDNQWVKAAHDAEFLEFEDLPPEYENLVYNYNLRSIFKNIMKAINTWLHIETKSDEEKSWAFLSRQIDHAKILALLAYYIDNGCRNIQNNEQRSNALLASRVYYKLLTIPGYKAYHIYHSQLFVHSLTCLAFPKAMCENENNYFNSRELTYEVNAVIKELSKFVLDLRLVVQNLQLTPSDMNYEDILSNLLDITGCAIVNKLNVDKIELTKLSGMIYEIIDTLININNEPDPLALIMLFKCLLPKLVASSLDTRNAHNIVRASYVTYSGLLLSKYGKAALNGYMLLLQHLCYSQDGFERHDVRNARVTLVSGLMSLLPRKSYRKIVKWILKLSTTSKISHRQIAMELLAKLLSNEPEETKLTPENSNEANDSGICTDLNVENGDGIQVEDDCNKTPQCNASADESSQDSQVLSLPPEKDDTEIMEDIMAGLHRQRPHTAPHGEILLALYNRVHDISSTLRSRAIAILTECLDNTRPAIVQAIKELNGDSEVSRLFAVGARSVCDERAAVRRAGAALVQRLLTAPDYSPQHNDLAILVGQCRDASLIVRVSAITALGDLVDKRPSEVVVDAFLNGPMHQLSDPETKVQDQVIGLIKQLLIERLKVFVGRESEDPLPWMFLAGVTRRNMKKHLQKACTLMSKDGSHLNHRLVDILSSHLGVLDDERDLYCLLLLVCVARHVQYSNVGFLFNYYYKIADNQQGFQGHDSRLMPLTLELMISWCRFAHPAECSALRDHLLRRLADSNNDGCRIATATLAACLDPDNLTWATELMQQSERSALMSSDIEEAVRAADLSLIAPVPPSPQLLHLFVNTLTYLPKGWGGSAVGAGACVAGAGRLCVRARDAAVLAAPALAALLPDAAAPLPARLNSLLALTDICIRYASIVEPLLGLVCGCLSLESPPELRRATARALTRLLLGGFLRLRAPLYYQYCALLADEDHDVREPAEYYVTSCLGVEIIYNNFVECVKYYNKADSEDISFDSRQLIYDVMLQRLSTVQRLNVQCRLAREVLQHAADIADESDDELPPELNDTLLDTITLLCGPRMKLPKKPQNTSDAADIEELQERVTTNIVSHKMKRTVAEVLVPAVLRLYGRMRTRGGQLAAYLVRIATDLLIDYRQEIEELIDTDEDLVERIHQFQENIGQTPTFGNARNLVTSTAPPEPETPRAPRRRPRAPHAPTPRKRALRI